jgi:hypothetical protein
VKKRPEPLIDANRTLIRGVGFLNAEDAEGCGEKLRVTELG